jgi:hypothetical protein
MFFTTNSPQRYKGTEETKGVIFHQFEVKEGMKRREET